MDLTLLDTWQTAASHTTRLVTHLQGRSKADHLETARHDDNVTTAASYQLPVQHVSWPAAELPCVCLQQRKHAQRSHGS
jgi:hypothetical protein